jgi:hypothetical protein
VRLGSWQGQFSGGIPLSLVKRDVLGVVRIVVSKFWGLDAPFIFGFNVMIELPLLTLNQIHR